MEPTADSLEEEKKSRNRVPTSCSVCRRRKMKCDKQRPQCGACIETGYAELCVYESQPWEKSLAQENRRLRGEVSEMEERIRQLEERLLVGAGAAAQGAAPPPPRAAVLTPTANAADPVFNLTEKFDVMVANEEKLMHYGTTSFVSLMNEEYIDEPHYAKIIQRLTVENNIWGVSHPPISTHSPLVEGGEDKHTILNAYLKILGIQGDSFRTSDFLPDLSRQFQEVLPPINMMMPPRRLFDALLQRFFRYAYYVAPYVDETLFRAELNAILYTSPDGRAFFALTRASQLSTVCAALVLLRFAFITVPAPDQLAVASSPLDAPHDALAAEIAGSGVVIGTTYIEHAKQCLSYGAVFRNTDMRNVQALLLFKMYRFYLPESGKEGFECLLSILVQMARMHGLHRDPGKFGRAIRDERTKHLWRKIWAQLLYWDCAQALFYGCPLLIYDDQFDTKAPHLSPALAAEGTLFVHEKEVVANLVLQLEATALVRSIVRLCSSTTVPPKRSELVLKLREVDHVLNFRLRTFEDFLRLKETPTPDWVCLLGGVQCGLRVFLTSAYYTVNSILYLTCLPHEPELRQSFADTSVERGMVLVKLCYTFFGNQKSRLYSRGLETLLAPMILDGALPALHMFCSTSIRNAFDLTRFAEAIQSFTSVDSVGVLRWFVHYSASKHTTPAGCILLLVEELFYMSKALSTNYYRCYQICMILRMFIIIYKDFHTQPRPDQGPETLNPPSKKRPRVDRVDFLSPSSTSNTSTPGIMVSPLPALLHNDPLLAILPPDALGLNTQVQEDFWKLFFGEDNTSPYEALPNFSEPLPHDSDLSAHFLNHMNNAIISLLPHGPVSASPLSFSGVARPAYSGPMDEFGRPQQRM